MHKKSSDQMFKLAVGCLAVGALMSLPGSVRGAVSFSGYLDILAESLDTDGADTVETAGVETYELVAATDLGDGLTATAHITGNGENDISLEQAHLVYAINEQCSLIAGKYLSALGWEAFHSKDLYQISTSATLVYPGMMNGAGVRHTADTWSLYGAVLAGVFDSTDRDLDEIGYEAQLKLMPAEGLTVQLGYASEGYAATDTAASYDQTLINIWASYKVGSLLLAAEYNEVSDWGAAGTDGDGFLIMANKPVNEKLSVTLRYSELDTGATDITKYTISPSYAMTDDWRILAEYNSQDNGTGADSELLALKSILTF